MAWIGLACSAKAQLAPFQWSFSSKKIADKTFAVRLSCTVNAPWHIYSQATPEGGPVPTKIIFNKNPLVVPEGSTREEGKLVQKHEEVFDVNVKYFNGRVDFVQTVKLKSNVKTNITGSVEFMVCNDEQCLPPATLPFSIDLK